MCPVFFLLRFWYRESITLSNWESVVARMYCHTLFPLFAHSQWIPHSCPLNLHFLQSKILISWFSLYLVVSIFVFTFCILFPLPLLCIYSYLGVSCLALRILMHQMAALLFSNYSFVFYRCYTFLIVELLLWRMYRASCAVGYPGQQMHCVCVCVRVRACVCVCIFLMFAIPKCLTRI